MNAVSIGNGGYNFTTDYPTVKDVLNGKPFKSAFMVNKSAYLESSILDILGIKYTGSEKIKVKNYTYIKWTALPLNYKNIDGGFSFTKE